MGKAVMPRALTAVWLLSFSGVAIPQTFPRFGSAVFGSSLFGPVYPATPVPVLNDCKNSGDSLLNSLLN